MRRAGALVLAAAALAAAIGCDDPMRRQARRDVYEPDPFFADGLSARPLVPGTVPRGGLAPNEAFVTGRAGGAFVEAFPLDVDRELLRRGRERYDAFCAPCHDRAGYGRGPVVRRGFRAPASFHEERLRAAPPGHFVDAMKSGFGAMAPMTPQVNARDRWAIAAWIRVLQQSQRTAVADLDEDERRRLAGDGK